MLVLTSSPLFHNRCHQFVNRHLNSLLKVGSNMVVAAQPSDRGARCRVDGRPCHSPPRTSATRPTTKNLPALNLSSIGLRSRNSPTNGSAVFTHQPQHHPLPSGLSLRLPATTMHRHKARAIDKLIKPGVYLQPHSCSLHPSCKFLLTPLKLNFLSPLPRILKRGN